MNLKFGQTYVATLTGSDGSTPAQVNVTVSVGSILSTVVAGNQVTIKALAPGTTVVTYSATGYNSASETVVVSPLPNLVVTDGPVN